MNGPHWIKQWISELALLNEQFRDENGTVDFEALGREEFQFRMALITRNFKKSERAKVVFEQAAAAYQVNVERGKKGGRPKKNLSADGDTREDSLNVPDGSDAVTLESATSADTRTLPLPTWEDFLSFVDGEGLDYTDAREWWEMTMVDRKGHDRNGKPIGNWKVTCRRFCESKAKKRSTQK